MKRRIAAMLCAGLLLSAGCGPVAVSTPPPAPETTCSEEIPALPPLLSDEEEFAALMDEVNARNAALDAPTEDLSKYRYKFEDGKPLFTEEDAALTIASEEAVEEAKEISRADAEREIDWYFRLLRAKYGLYTFYGGDSAFDAAKEALYAQLDAGPDTLSVSGEYGPMLREALGFVRDKHSWLGGKQLCPNMVLLKSMNDCFRRRGERFYGGADYERRVVSVDGMVPEQCMRRAIGPEGELTWGIYLQVNEEEAGVHSASVLYADGAREYATLVPALAAKEQDSPREPVTEQVAGDVYTVRTAYMPMETPRESIYAEGDDVVYSQILDTAQRVRDYPVAIFDLRWNGGGNGGLIDAWFASYTGETLQPNYNKLCIRRQIDGSQGTKEYDEGFVQNGWTVDGDYYLRYSKPQFVDPEGPLLIVRTGKGTGSAAEAFTDMARNLKDTLVVGGPTGGVLTGDMSYFGIALPWSQLKISYGTALFHWDSDYFSEGVGMEPDLYLVGNNLDERLERFLARYALP